MSSFLTTRSRCSSIRFYCTIDWLLMILWSVMLLPLFDPVCWTTNPVLTKLPSTRNRSLLEGSFRDWEFTLFSLSSKLPVLCRIPYPKYIKNPVWEQIWLLLSHWKSRTFVLELHQEIRDDMRQKRVSKFITLFSIFDQSANIFRIQRQRLTRVICWYKVSQLIQRRYIVVESS